MYTYNQVREMLPKKNPPETYSHTVHFISTMIAIDISGVSARSVLLINFYSKL